MAKQNGRGRNPRKPSRKPSSNRNPKQDIYEEQEAPVRNNAHMYFENEALATQLSDFSFNQYGGLQPPTDNIQYVGTACRLTANPSLGWLEGNQSEGINSQAIKLYTQLSSGNMKTTNYAPQDITTLIAGFGQVLAMIEFAKRAFGILYTYNQRNRAFAYGMIKAAGFDPHDLHSHVADSRAKLNILINQMNNIPMFNNITYFDKCRLMYSKIYSDSESPMAQYYVVTPESTWKIDEESYSQGTILATQVVLNTSSSEQTLKMDYFIDNILQPMVTNLLNSATFNYIYSDILRLNKEGSTMFTLELLPDQYAVLPEYNPMMLLQFHNATIVGQRGSAYWEYDDDNQKIYTPGSYTPQNDVLPDMDNLSLIYMPKLQTTKRVYAAQMDAVINFPHSMGSPDLDQRIDVSRYTVIPDPTVVVDPSTEYFGEDMPIIPWSLSDYYFSHLYMFILNGDETVYELDSWSGFNTWTGLWLPFNTTAQIDSLAKNMLALLPLISQFEYFPHIYTSVIYDKNNFMDKKALIDSELDFYTTLDFNYLSRLNDFALMGLFAVR